MIFCIIAKWVGVRPVQYKKLGNDPTTFWLWINKTRLWTDHELVKLDDISVSLWLVNFVSYSLSNISDFSFWNLVIALLFDLFVNYVTYLCDDWTCIALLGRYVPLFRQYYVFICCLARFFNSYYLCFDVPIHIQGPRRRGYT